MNGRLPQFADRPPQAITFDFWDTLVRADTAATRRVRHSSMTEALARFEVPVGQAALDEALAMAVRTYVEHWHANRQFSAEDGALLVVRELGLDGDDTIRDELIGAYVRAGSLAPQQLTPNVAEVLAALAEAGIRLGIICDVGMTPSPVLRDYLTTHGVLDLFDHWSFSDEVGVFKPDPVIFRHALDGLGGLEPTRVAHVGDLRRTDVAGAVGAGMVAVRYAGINDDGMPTLEGGPEAEPGETLPEAHAVITDHRELLTAVGVA